MASTVGMGDEAACVRHPNAADHHMIALAEGVDVVAGAGPDVAELACKPGFLADEVFGRGQFHVGNIAFKCRHRQSRPFGERRIVGEIGSTLARSAAVGVENYIETKRLRRLRNAQPRPLRRCLDIAGLPDQLDGVGNRDRGDGRAGAACRIDRP